MNRRNRKRFIINICVFVIVLTEALTAVRPVMAQPGDGGEETLTETEQREQLPVSSNLNENWPTGPVVGAQSAVLLEAESGTILYAKNMDEKLYPASTTKMLTALLAVEKGQLEDIVTFTQSAIDANAPDGSNMAMRPGESASLHQSLYGLLVQSANEAANAIAEHIGGSIPDFVRMMNEKAVGIGCKNSRFVNPSGLHDDGHYVTAYDMALIGREFFRQPVLCTISHTRTYHIELPNREFDIYSQNKFFNGEYNYDGLVGSKTGYTDHAQSTLVSCAQRGNMKLICVVMKEESPHQFADTVKLFDYGFQNFSMVNVAQNEIKFELGGSDFVEGAASIFGGPEAILTPDKSAYVCLPGGVSLPEAESRVTYGPEEEGMLPTVQYSYYGVPVGSAGFTMEQREENSVKQAQAGAVIYINVGTALLGLTMAALILILLSILLEHGVGGRRERRRARKRWKKR